MRKMLALEDEPTRFDSLFSLMDTFDEDDDDEISFLDVQQNLNTYSWKKLSSLANVLKDCYCGLANKKDSLINNLDEFKIKRVSLYSRIL